LYIRDKEFKTRVPVAFKLLNASVWRQENEISTVDTSDLLMSSYISKIINKK